MRGILASELNAKVAFLRQPASYPGRIRRVEAIETHFAWVFLAGRHAYKLKKPMRHQAMDYRSLAARERGCREELRLNRRLARSVYLDVMPLMSRNGILALGGRGDVADWLVRMRRLPASRSLDRTLGRRALRLSEFEALMSLLTRFFAGAERRPMTGRAYIKRLRRQVTANCHALQDAGRRVRQSLVGEAIACQRACLRIGVRLFASRAAFIVEGHGDLRAEHVYLGDPPCVIDCLEFDDDLRRLDPAEEISFLALEVERLGHASLAQQFLRRHRERSAAGIADAVTSFYMSHRAATRAKLAVWHLDDPQFPDARPWLARAHADLRQALRHSRAALESLQVPRRLRGTVGRPALE